jgi:hypothetical protein
MVGEECRAVNGGISQFKSRVPGTRGVTSRGGTRRRASKRSSINGEEASGWRDVHTARTHAARPPGHHRGRRARRPNRRQEGGSDTRAGLQRGAPACVLQIAIERWQGGGPLCRPPGTEEG